MSASDRVVVSRYCPSCRAQIKAWRLVREGGKVVERCADCGNADLREIREEIGKMQS